MELDGVHRHAEALGDLGVRLALRRAAEHFLLPCCEPGQALFDRRHVATVFRPEIASIGPWTSIQVVHLAAWLGPRMETCPLCRGRVRRARVASAAMSDRLSDGTVKHRAKSGIFFVGAWGAINLLVGFGGNLVLARLLTPRDFGIVAIGATLM